MLDRFLLAVARIALWLLTILSFFFIVTWYAQASRRSRKRFWIVVFCLGIFGYIMNTITKTQ